MRDSARSLRAYRITQKWGDSMKMDLLLRYLIIGIALQLACAWIKEFGLPWPLTDAFDLAENVEDQLFKSLGISFASLTVPQLSTFVWDVALKRELISSSCNHRHKRPFGSTSSEHVSSVMSAISFCFIPSSR